MLNKFPAYGTQQVINNIYTNKIIEFYQNHPILKNVSIKEIKYCDHYYNIIPQTNHTCHHLNNHAHQGQYVYIWKSELVLKCWSKSCDGFEPEIIGSVDQSDFSKQTIKYKLQNNSINFDNDLTPTHHGWYLDFNLSQQHIGGLVFIKSSLGTGKTEFAA